MNKVVRDYEKHFIFNSLNAIKYFCRVDNEKASEIITIFANLLNYMIFDERKYVSAFEEFELVEYIKSIQEIRFNNNVALIREEIENIYIPKGIIFYIFLLGYNLNILRSNETKVKIKVKNKIIEIKIFSNLKLNLEEIKQNEFFKEVYKNLSDLNCKVSLNLNCNQLYFNIFL